MQTASPCSQSCICSARRHLPRGICRRIPRRPVRGHIDEHLRAPPRLNLPQMFSLVLQHVIVASSSPAHQTVEVETPIHFAFFTSQCYEKTFIGDATDFGHFLQPAKRHAVSNVWTRDGALECRRCKKVPLDSRQ